MSRSFAELLPTPLTAESLALLQPLGRAAKFLVSAGDGLLFIEFHNLPTIADLQRHSLNTLRILRG